MERTQNQNYCSGGRTYCCNIYTWWWGDGDGDDNGNGDRKNANYGKYCG